MPKRFTLRSPLTATFAEQFPELSKKQAAVAESVANRAVLYAGPGRSEWFKGREYEASGNYIAVYEALDTKGTCSPCLEAQGEYLPSTGPFPGSVCRGGGRCRCRRTLRYNPKRAAELRAA